MRRDRVYQSMNMPRKGSDLLNFGASTAGSPPPGIAADGGPDVQRATFAAGCFWGVEASLREVEGVLRTRVGYTGGSSADPSYEQVCSGSTGHAEAVDVWFDPAIVTYDELLSRFWALHDPTTRDRQGWDFGSQYRSAIFVHGPEQERMAIDSRDRRQGALSRPIVTEIVAAGEFYDAEDYHQRFFEKNGGAVCATTVR
jgi:methionine-S-sulfoxide reductase